MAANPDSNVPNREMEGIQISSLLLNRRPTSSDAVCIFSVPKKLSKGNEEAYTPQAVSIGPLHYGSAHLRAMQPIKERYLERFLKRPGLNMNSIYEKAKLWEDKVRACYQSDITLDSQEFVRMLLADGIFLVEFLTRMCEPEMKDREQDDIFKNALLKMDIFNDMILLENQLPFFVIKDLITNFYHGSQWENFLCEITKKYLWEDVEFSTVTEVLQTRTIRHLVDFLHDFCVVSISKHHETITKARGVPQQPARGDIIKKPEQFELSRSVRELHEAGIMFKRAEGELPFDLVLEDGTLKFPPIIVTRWTESFFRNLIAYEHCLHKAKVVSSYIIMLGSLLKTPKDVKLLVGQGIIENRSLGDNADVCNLFKKLYNGSMMDNTEFFYTSLCKDLNNYSKDRWHQWLASFYRWRLMLKRDYFSNPWSIIALIAAFVALVLTIVQTVSSVLSTDW